MKNIVVCCDGTKAEYGKRSENSNIIRLYELLKPDDQGQISYYDPGVGTYSPSRGTITRWIEKQVMAASGWGLELSVERAYTYLMNYYENDDHVFLFGYSRGAHTVRELAHLLHRCGLLTKGSENLIPFAMKLCRSNHDARAERFKNTFSRKCKPHLIGVFDTVAAVGWLQWRKYYLRRPPSPDLRYGYHALSLDENRFYFPPSRWDEKKVTKDQDIEEVWFPGFHGDVGGQTEDRGIADIPLEWMLLNAAKQGLHLKKDWTDSLNPDPRADIKPSRRHIWRLVPARKRRLRPASRIHQSVADRMRLLGSDYDPANLPKPNSCVIVENPLPNPPHPLVP